MIVQIRVGPFDDVDDMHIVVDVLLAVFNAVPKEMGVPVETSIIERDGEG